MSQDKWADYLHHKDAIVGMRIIDSSTLQTILVDRLENALKSDDPVMNEMAAGIINGILWLIEEQPVIVEEKKAWN